MREFIHASYRMKNGEPFSYSNYLTIKVKHFDNEKSKFQYLSTKIPYEIEYKECRAMRHGNIEPAGIRLD